MYTHSYVTATNHANTSPPMHTQKATFSTMLNLLHGLPAFEKTFLVTVAVAVERRVWVAVTMRGWEVGFAETMGEGVLAIILGVGKGPCPSLKKEENAWDRLKAVCTMDSALGPSGIHSDNPVADNLEDPASNGSFDCTATMIALGETLI